MTEMMESIQYGQHTNIFVSDDVHNEGTDNEYIDLHFRYANDGEKVDDQWVDAVSKELQEKCDEKGYAVYVDTVTLREINTVLVEVHTISFHHPQHVNESLHFIDEYATHLTKSQPPLAAYDGLTKEAFKRLVAKHVNVEFRVRNDQPEVVVKVDGEEVMLEENPREENQVTYRMAVIWGRHFDRYMVQAKDQFDAMNQFREKFGFNSIPIQVVVDYDRELVYTPAFKGWSKADSSDRKRYFD